MKNIERWSLGFVSTCFLAVGLGRAADMLDPVNRELKAMEKGSVDAATPDCIAMCNIAERATPDCIPACYIAEHA